LKLAGYVLLLAAAISTLLSPNFGEYSVVLPLIMLGISLLAIPKKYQLSVVRIIGWAIILASACIVFRLPYSEKFILLVPFMLGYWLAGLRYTNNGKRAQYGNESDGGTDDGGD